MIPAIQREALTVLAELCELSSHDDVRFGQLLALIGLLGEDDTGRNLWTIEDDELLAILNLHKSQLLARLPESKQKTYRSSISITQDSPVPDVGSSANVGG